MARTRLFYVHRHERRHQCRAGPDRRQHVSNRNFEGRQGTGARTHCWPVAGDGRGQLRCGRLAVTDPRAFQGTTALEEAS